MQHCVTFEPLNRIHWGVRARADAQVGLGLPPKWTRPKARTMLIESAALGLLEHIETELGEVPSAHNFRLQMRQMWSACTAQCSTN